MRRRLTVCAAAAAAVSLVTSVGPALAASTHAQGFVNPDACGSVQHVVLSSPAAIRGTVAATNAGGYAYMQILDPSGAVRSYTGSYDAPGAGVYGFRVCFVNGDGIDLGHSLEYEAAVTTG